MKWHYRIFLWLFLLVFFSPFYDFPYYLYGITTFVHMFKISLIGLLFIAVVFHFKNKLLLSFESFLFLTFGFFSFLFGLIVNQKINSILLSHLYTAVMPIFCISFGMHFARDFNDVTRKLLHRIFNISFYLVSVLLILYYYFYYVTKEFGYYGYGTGMPFIGSFLLTHEMYLKYFLGLGMVVLSGKRTSLITMLLILLLYAFNKGLFLLIKGKLFTPSRILLISLALIFCWNGFQYAENQGYFRRWDIIMKWDFLNLQDNDKMNLATSGRWEESKNVVKFLKQEPIKWITGAGMGGEYLTPRTMGKEDFEPQHYAHFSPLSYLFVYGIPFTVLLYLSFFITLYRGIKFINNFFYLSFIVFFITSFVGSILFVDPRVWFLWGIVKFIVKNRKKSPYILTNS